MDAEKDRVYEDPLRAPATSAGGVAEEGARLEDAVKGLPGFHGAAQLLKELQEMVVDARAVRDSVASSLDEQQWLMDAEREVYGIVVQGFLQDVSEQVSSLRRSELTYRRDLQKAEAEVDLLGDEVELLVRLLRKAYRALDHYSPVLQHYRGIKELLCLLGEELPMWHYVQ